MMNSKKVDVLIAGGGSQVLLRVLQLLEMAQKPSSLTSKDAWVVSLPPECLAHG